MRIRMKGEERRAAIVREAIRRVVDLDCQTFSLNVD